MSVDLKTMVMGISKGTYSLDDVYKEMCKTICENVGSTRSSIWLFNEFQTSINCQCLYDTRTGEFYKDIKLKDDDFPKYFEAIKKDLKIVAHDAENHPATNEFTDLYFIPNDIRSLLDHVVLNAGEPTGVLCCEHCTDIKHWSEDNENYLKQMAVILGLTFKFAKVA